MILKPGMWLTSLSVQEIIRVIETAQRLNLDFDDAYQYVVVGKHALEILSFYADFDWTEKGRKTPDNL